MRFPHLRLPRPGAGKGWSWGYGVGRRCPASAMGSLRVFESRRAPGGHRRGNKAAVTRLWHSLLALPAIPNELAPPRAGLFFLKV